MVDDWLYGLLGGLLIGTASALLLLGNGRIAGISGILGTALGGRELRESLPFLAGLVGLPALYTLCVGTPMIGVTDSAPLLLMGGLLVGARHPARQRLHLRARGLRPVPAVATLHRCDRNLPRQRRDRRLRRPSPDRSRLR